MKAGNNNWNLFFMVVKIIYPLKLLKKLSKSDYDLFKLQ